VPKHSSLESLEVTTPSAGGGCPSTASRFLLAKALHYGTINEPCSRLLVKGSIVMLPKYRATTFLLLALGSLPVLAAPPNVVLILADDLGSSDLGCYGADLHETPHLDRFASRSIRFTQAYAASVCSPTRASLLTGRHYARLGITTWRESARHPPKDKPLLTPTSVADLPYSAVTLAEVFKEAGYRTAIVGKWHLGAAQHYPETQGFDINIGGTLWGAPQTYFYPYKGAGRFQGEFRYVPHLEGGKEGEYLTDRLTDEALKVIDQAGDQPFFLYLAHHAPHSPIQAKKEKIARYEKKLAPGLRHQNATYAAMVESVDESVGRVLGRLQERGLADRTIVVFLSDNGGHIGQYEGKQVTNNDPLRSGKGSMYEGGIRIPLIIHAPGARDTEAISAEPVYVADLYETLRELTGVSNSEGDFAEKIKIDRQEIRSPDGLSLVPIMRDPSATLPREALYFHFPHYYPTTTPASAIRMRDWKLIEYLEGPRQELFNLKEDPGESSDLSANDPSKVKELLAKLDTWRKDVSAPMPTPHASDP
jgi:arylsulfatase A-like enzyme